MLFFEKLRFFIKLQNYYDRNEIRTYTVAEIIEVDKNVFPHIAKKLGANPELIAKANNNIIDSYPKVSGGNINLSNIL